MDTIKETLTLALKVADDFNDRHTLVEALISLELGEPVDLEPLAQYINLAGRYLDENDRG